MTGQSRGFAFIEFISVEEATKALKRSVGLRIENQPVRIAYSRRDHLFETPPVPQAGFPLLFLLYIFEPRQNNYLYTLPVVYECRKLPRSHQLCYICILVNTNSLLKVVPPVPAVPRGPPPTSKYHYRVIKLTCY